MKTLIEFILNHLVSHPEDVVVEETTDYSGSVYKITVNPDDMGRIIGRGGAVIKAIRRLVSVKAIKDGVRAQVVVEG